MNQSFVKSMTFLACATLLSACTMKSQDPPPYAGPSELGQSVGVAVSPDSLPQDGASQSLITVTVRDANAQPMRNVTVRLEMRVNGTLADFGSLSARSVVTGADGRATAIYTAPASPAISVDEFTIVDIGATPLGTDFNNALTRSAAIRLTPQGPVVPPTDLRAAFIVTPAGPQDNQTVLFDASSSSGSIAEYQWSFGDGATGLGRLTSHAYASPGTYVITLTIVDPFGRSTSTAQSITVTPSANPTAAFNFSPTNPRVGQQMTFNASASRPPAGGRIVSYTWEWGDGTDRVTTSDPLVAHTFGRAATYTVTLVVTDNLGRTATISLSIQVAP
jgi:PKD repeat protein